MTFCASLLFKHADAVAGSLLRLPPPTPAGRLQQRLDPLLGQLAAQPAATKKMWKLNTATHYAHMQYIGHIKIAQLRNDESAVSTKALLQ